MMGKCSNQGEKIMGGGGIIQGEEGNLKKMQTTLMSYRTDFTYQILNESGNGEVLGR